MTKYRISKRTHADGRLSYMPQSRILWMYLDCFSQGFTLKEAEDYVEKERGKQIIKKEKYER